ncbi:MAG: hypothetical protein H6867_04865 [Rhodospirillales bacterium]|nr:hypothetical protein [Rhodospirillales bacterium]MCB9994832.1 hypothetical protein [Rhodospirillales bacterium]
MLQNLEYEPVVFGSCSVSVSEILVLLETYELSLDMTEGEIHKALVHAADQGCVIADELDLIEAIESAHKSLTTH